MANISYKVMDPLAQSFEILEEAFPNGVFVSSVDIFFQSKAIDAPVLLDIRYMNIGLPTRVSVPLSQVSLNPNSINTSNNGTVATKFTFQSPIYLPVGEYAIVLRANSNEYDVFVSVFGERDIVSGNLITKQPFSGSLFKSQNASTWTPDQFKDLKFVLRRCSFETGTSTIDFISEQYTAEQKYAVSQIITREHLPGTPTSLAYQIKTRGATSNTIGSFEGTLTNQNMSYDTTKQINPSANGEITVRASLYTSDERVSPVIDATRFGGILVRNLVNNVTTNETEPRNGLAISKYITNRVNLADGFEATKLKVILNVNRPLSTDIQVYYKVLSQYDYTPFGNRPYVLLPKVDLGGYSYTGDNQYIEEEYYAEDIEYIGTDGSGGRYTDFKAFAIKVVFLSSNEAAVPRIKDLRAIALA